MSGTYFPSSAQMQSWLAPVVVDAAEQLGSRANIFELADVKQLDASSEKLPNNLPIQGVAIKLTQLTSELAQEVFGQNTNVTWKGKMARVEPVELGNVFEIYEGAFEGQNLEVVEVIENPLSDSYLIGFIDYEGEL